METNLTTNMEPITRVCKKCGKEKPIEEFVRNKGVIGGFEYRCRQCAYKNSREWAARHKDRQKEYYKEHYKKACDKDDEYNKKQYLKYKEKYKEHRERRREYYNDHSKKWRNQNREYFQRYYEQNRNAILAHSKENHKRLCEKMTDKYIARLLHRQTNIPIDCIIQHADLIKLKREQLNILRLTNT